MFVRKHLSYSRLDKSQQFFFKIKKNYTSVKNSGEKNVHQKHFTAFIVKKTKDLRNEPANILKF